MSNINTVTVVGGGVLGGQIAWQSCYKGKSVVVYDIDRHAIDRCRAACEQYAATYASQLGATPAELDAAWGRLSFTTDLAQAVADADLVIEAVPEIPEIKRAVYEEMAPLLPTRTLVATNSSTFVPSDFAAATGRPAMFCALHFATTIWAINFAEIMAHAGTERATLLAVTEFAIEIGMVPIPVRKEWNGYVVNTWFVALHNAAQTLVTNGIATPEDVDRSFMLGGNRLGPMAVLDQVGMKTVYDVLSYWGRANDDTQMTANAAYIKENFIDKGLLGAQTGQGYYSWPDAACLSPDFLAVPDVSRAAEIVAQLLPTEPEGPRRQGEPT